MATALEYGLIAAGVCLAIVATVKSTKTWGSNDEKKQAAALCAARPAGSKENVIVKSSVGQFNMEFKCSNAPTLLHPTLVGRTAH